jgi:hypothetical protein
MVHFAPAARLDPQAFPKTNAEALVPLTLMLLIANVAVPVFVKVTD